MKKKILSLMPYIIIIVVVVLIRSFIITPVRVEGSSMDNYLKDGDMLLLYKLGKYTQNDIVVLNNEKDDEVIIKRIIGLPGDTVEIKNQTVYINDKEFSDEYAYGFTEPKVEKYTKVTLKDDEYYCLGDNRLVSKDSRVLGPVNKKDIKGVVIFRIFPFSKFGKV